MKTVFPIFLFISATKQLFVFLQAWAMIFTLNTYPGTYTYCRNCMVEIWTHFWVHSKPLFKTDIPLRTWQTQLLSWLKAIQNTPVIGQCWKFIFRMPLRKTIVYHWQTRDCCNCQANIFVSKVNAVKWKRAIEESNFSSMTIKLGFITSEIFKHKLSRQNNSSSQRTFNI